MFAISALEFFRDIFLPVCMSNNPFSGIRIIIRVIESNLIPYKGILMNIFFPALEVVGTRGLFNILSESMYIFKES